MAAITAVACWVKSRNATLGLVAIAEFGTSTDRKRRKQLDNNSSEQPAAAKRTKPATRSSKQLLHWHQQLRQPQPGVANSSSEKHSCNRLQQQLRPATPQQQLRVASKATTARRRCISSLGELQNPTTTSKFLRRILTDPY
ncbi:hypothetical protein H5410_052504 [Solanum commersonii]|uniref:Uncharacterized protein n=1 Tax=Solanum commersonii TaxID=4109 RepID=A0A9J5X377_SOLCO|nr:hypothetical protein H5410_052504 [Solanum commersonii]